jgi:hypothetical protein
MQRLLGCCGPTRTTSRARARHCAVSSSSSPSRARPASPWTCASLARWTHFPRGSTSPATASSRRR